MSGLTQQEWIGQLRPALLAQMKAEGCQTMERFLLTKICWLLDERETPPRRVLFAPNDAQRDFLDTMWYWNVIMKSRQQGFSSLLALLVFIFALLNPDYRAGIIDRTDQEARKKLARIRFAWDMLHLTPLGAAFKAAIPLVSPTNEHMMTLGNGAQIYAATSLRGGTLNFLWISELGTIALKDPKKAEEIMGGSLEAVHPGNIIVSESTHEGGRSGEHYRLIRRAQKSPPHPLITNMQWRFHFFGWWKNPRYALEPYPGQKVEISAEYAAYFAALETGERITLTLAQKNWYILKAASQPNMARQYPGTSEEALRATAAGAIYGAIISKLRAKGRVCDLVHMPEAQLLTAWDLGENDASAVWLLQIVGPDFHALDFHCGNGMTPREHADHVLSWERKWGGHIATNYLPHDGKQRKLGTTWQAELKKAGLQNIRIVDRIPNVWIGINQTRERLPRFRFNAAMCDDKEFPISEFKSWPSGLAQLEGYRTTMDEATGVESDPVHDECESGASALRTFCEAHAKGMLVGPSRMEEEARHAVRKPVMAKTGVSRPSYEKPKQQRALMH